MTQRIILVTGPARSGKSEWAERLVAESQKSVIYVATAQRYEDDRDWDARIDRHIARRPKHWQSLEVPLHLAETIAQAKPDECLLIDSLGSWVGNSLAVDDDHWRSCCQHLISSIDASVAQLVFVSEETGWGVIPAYPIGRLFRDRLGQLVREIGQQANQTFLVVAGFAIDLQQIGIPIDRP